MGKKGIIALIGSGELTSTMVEVHKMLLSRLGNKPVAAFLDTPAGFQLNADQIAAKAVDYFARSVGYHIDIASYRSKVIEEMDAALAFQKLREAEYILMGPGSPTYALDHLTNSPIPSILIDTIRQGGCLVAASAAALTMGRHTLPVYEIYKVGQPLHWQTGLNLLQEFGIQLAVVPHWNNAEGGTHDTSCCFMGKARFKMLTDLLDQTAPILGLDEHTACVIDLANDSFQIHGIGTVTYLASNRRLRFSSGTDYPLSILRGEEQTSDPLSVQGSSAEKTSVVGEIQDGFRQLAHGLEGTFRQAIAAADDKGATRALLEMDRLLWAAAGEHQSPIDIADCRDLFRELLVVIGTAPKLTPAVLRRSLEPLVETLLLERQRLRSEGKWSAADTLRDSLMQAGIVVEDSAASSEWRLKDHSKEEYDQAP